jgi:predicted TPR repeat methyltransferase
MTTVETQAFWEEHYGKSDRIWSGRANPVLVSTVESMTPGTADVSPTAISRGQQAAEAAGVGDLISWEAHDFTVSLPEGTFDLVSAQFLQAPIEFPLDTVLPAAATKVAPGGLLLIVSHASAPTWAPAEHHSHNVRFPTPQETLESLKLSGDEWRIDRVEVAERAFAAPDGTPGHLHDSVVAVTRMS